jgi:hypothetical protein
MEQSGRNQRQPAANRPAPTTAQQAISQPSAAHGNGPGLDGKEGVDGSSPSEGLKVPANQRFLLSALSRK